MFLLNYLDNVNTYRKGEIERAVRLMNEYYKDKESNEL